MGAEQSEDRCLIRPARPVRAGDTQVCANGHGWALKPSLPGHPTRAYDTREQALAAALELARIEGGRIEIRERDGSVRFEVILGRATFERVSAVEGIELTPAMRGDLRALDATELSGEERRRILIEKYGKPGRPRT